MSTKVQANYEQYRKAVKDLQDAQAARKASATLLVEHLTSGGAFPEGMTLEAFRQVEKDAKAK